MKIYCLVCNEEFEADVATYCPHCGAVGDDLEENPPEEPEPRFEAPAFLPKHFLDLATKHIGLEDSHTIAIARIVELCGKGIIPIDEGAILCHATYYQGLGAYHQIED